MYKYYKINNLINDFGEYDYKGLDTSLFVAGGQIYPRNENHCFIATKEETNVKHEDLTEIHEDEYKNIKKEYNESLKQEQQKEENKIKELEEKSERQEKEITAMALTMAEIMGM